MVEFINVLINFIAIIIVLIMIRGKYKKDTKYYTFGSVIGLIGLYLMYISTPWIQI